MHNVGTVSTYSKVLMSKMFIWFSPCSGIVPREEFYQVWIGGGGYIFVKSEVLFVALLGGAWYDLREHRIPNWWCALSCACGLWLVLETAPQGQRIWDSVFYAVRLLLMAAVWFPLFRFRMIGAGDIKLMAVMAGFLGIQAGIRTIFYGLLIGAVMALLKMLICGNLYQRLKYLNAYIRRLFLTKELIPYYQAGRDGEDAVIPLGLCLLGGYMWYLAGVV